MNPNRWLAALRFWLERQLAKGTLYRLAFIAGLIGLVSLIGGVLAHWLGQGGPLHESVWWAFLHLSDSGYLGDASGLLPTTLALIITVLGYALVTGSLIAILAEWLARQIRQLERGTTPVSMQHHIVLLGWTERTQPLLRELWASEHRVKRFLARRGSQRKLRLVVLDEAVSPELGDSLRLDPEIGPHSRNVILRAGSPLSREHLGRTDPGNAAAIIVSAQTYQDGSISSDTETIKMLLALDQFRAETDRTPPYVVAELQDPAHAPLARRAYQGPLELLPGDQFITHLLVQTLRNPGLSHVYPQILSQRAGHSVFIQRKPELAGLPAGDLRIPDDVLVLGRVKADGGAEIPIPGTSVLGADDALIVLAEDYSASATVTSGGARAPETLPAGLPDELPEPGEPEHVLIIGWSRLVPLLLHELAGGKTGATRVTLVSTRTVVERETLIGDGPVPDIEHIVGDVTRRDVWARLPVQQVDRVLFLSSDRLATGEEADARSLVAYLHLDMVLQDLPVGERPAVLLELADPANEHLLRERDCEALISPLILSHLLVQVALRRELASTHETLLGPTGPEIRIVRAHSLLAPQLHGSLTEAALSHWLSRHNARLVGRLAPDHSVRFGMAAQAPVRPEDRLVLLLPAASGRAAALTP